MLILITVWSLEKHKPTLLYNQATNCWTVIDNESGLKRLPASIQAQCPCRTSLNSYISHLYLVSEALLHSSLIQGLFPSKMSVLWRLPSAALHPPPQPVWQGRAITSSPFSLIGFIFAGVVSYCSLHYCPQSYSSVKNWRVKTLMQVQTVNFHSLKRQSPAELVPSLSLRCTWEQ